MTKEQIRDAIRDIRGIEVEIVLPPETARLGLTLRDTKGKTVNVGQVSQNETGVLVWFPITSQDKGTDA